MEIKVKLSEVSKLTSLPEQFPHGSGVNAVGNNLSSQDRLHPNSSYRNSDRNKKECVELVDFWLDTWGNSQEQ
jgi:hypothetical protein